MNGSGFFLPLLVVFCVAISLVIGLLDKWTEPKSSYRRWLEEELERNPDYINWLKGVNRGRDYKTGLKILTKIKKDENNSYKRWLKRIRKLGKW